MVPLEGNLRNIVKRFGVLSSKIIVLLANKGHRPRYDKNLVLMLKAVLPDSTNMSAGIQMNNGFTHHI